MPLAALVLDAGGMGVRPPGDVIRRARGVHGRVGGDDDGDDAAVGCATRSGVREARARQARARLSARLGDRRPTGLRGGESIRPDDGSGSSGGDGARRRGRLSVHAAQERVPARMPKPARLHRDAVGARSGSARSGARRLLRRLLLGPDGGARRRRRDEHHVGRGDRRRGVCREGASRGRMDRAGSGICIVRFGGRSSSERNRMATQSRHAGTSKAPPHLCNCDYGCP